MALPQVGVEAVVANLGKFQSATKTVNKSLGSIDSTVGKTVSSFSGLGASIISSASGAVVSVVSNLAKNVTKLGVAFAKSAVKEGMAFTKEMSNVIAVSNAGVTQIPMLTDTMERLGRTTKFTATEAAQGASFLAMAGFEVTEIMQALPGVLDLASAANLDLGKSADIVSNILTGYGGTAEETGRFVDILTKAFTTANTNLEQLGAAMKFAGPTAHALGQDVEDTTAAIAALADAGIQGALAGTSLRSILLSLAAPTKIATEEMQKLGLFTGLTDKQFQATQASASAVAEKIAAVDTSFDERQLAIYQEELNRIIAKYGEGSIQAEKKRLAIDELSASIDEQKGKLSELQAQEEALTTSLQFGQSAFFNLDGTMKPIADVIEALANATKDLSDEERAAAIKRIVGVRQFSALQVLIEKGPEAMKAYADELRNSTGTAARVAQTQLDNLSGSVTIFQSALSGIKVDAFQAIAPILRRVVDTGTTLLGQFGAKFTELSQIFSAGGLFGARAGSFGSVGLLAALGISPQTIGWIQDTIATVQELFNVFQRGGVRGLAEVIGITPEIFELLGKFQTLISNIGQTITTALGGETADFSFLDALNAGIVFLNDHFEELQGALAGIVGIGIVAVIAAIATAIAGLLTPVNLLVVGAATLGAAWAGNWGNIQGVVTNFIGVFMSSVVAPLQQAFANVTQALNNLGISWGDIFTALGVATGAVILGVVSAFTGLVAGIAQGVATFTSYLGEMQANSMQVFEGIIQLVYGARDVLTGVMTLDMARITQGFTLLWEGAKNTVVGIFSTIVTTVKAFGSTIYSVISGFVNTTIQTFRSLYDAIVGNSIIPDLVNDVIKWLMKLPEEAFTIGRDIVRGIKDGIDKNASQVFEVIKSMVQSAIEGAKNLLGISSPSTVFYGFGKNIIAGLIGGVSATAPQFHKTLLDAMNIQTRITARGMGENFAKVAKQFIGNLLGRSGVIEALNTGTLTAEKLREEANKLAVALNYPPSLVNTLTNFDSLAGDLVEKFTELQKQLRIENALGGLQRASQLLGLGSTAASRLQAELEENARSINELYGNIELPGMDGQTGNIVDIFGEIYDLTVKSNLSRLLPNSVKISEAEKARLNTLKKMALEITGSAEEYSRIYDTAVQIKKEEEARAKLAKQQADLQFLQQQLGLIKTLQDLGLNPQDVLGGITFGLDASLEDLINATSRATQAIINQVNSDLQISSPSKVMAKVGERIMQGLQVGMDRVGVDIPLLGSGRNTVNNYNYNFGMNVSTQSSPQAVIGQYGVMKSLVQ